MSVRDLSSVDGEKSGLKFHVVLPFSFSDCSCSVPKLLAVGLGFELGGRQDGFPEVQDFNLLG